MKSSNTFCTATLLASIGMTSPSTARAQDNWSDGLLELAALDGSNGFVLNGIADGDNLGFSVSAAGDLNGDGFDDLITGASAAIPPAQNRPGASYVVLGGNSIGSNGSFDLGALDGNNGFVIKGMTADDGIGHAVSTAGDVNGDGFDDLIVGAEYESNVTGTSYVMFGGAMIGGGGSIDPATLDGTAGFTLNGIDPFDGSGQSVASAGDVNGDGFNDLIIGAAGADPDNRSGAGESYVVFGGPTIGNNSTFDLGSLNGVTGFILEGANEGDNSGRSVSSAGDVNGDGFSDVIIGADFADPTGLESAGESYVVFGDSSTNGGSVALDVLDGTNGFVLEGTDSFERTGFSVSSAGDLNGDGANDLLIGSAPSNPISRGMSYVVFGGDTTGSNGSIDLGALDGVTGFTILGANSRDRAGRAVSNAGDINGDGFDDLIIGAPQAGAGMSYVVFGGVGIGQDGIFDLDMLNGTNGFVLNGVILGDQSGYSVSSAGDVNGDGIDDLIVGAWLADPNNISNSGQTYVVFGAFNPSADFNRDGSVDLLDLDILGANWALTATTQTGDANHDGIVDLLDLDILGAQWEGASCFSAALAASGLSVPEPGVAGSAGMAALAIYLRRRR